IIANRKSQLMQLDSDQTVSGKPGAIHAVAGVGVVEMPVIAVRDQLTAGLLVKLVPDWAPRRVIIHAVFPSRRGLLPSVRALIDFLAQRFETLHDD
ncbi:MAG: hypothetical protein K2Y09_11420, partial [Nitrosomonas sp.]|uniref:LysR substrate-binding domain-containing protein n=1 Tax=Nitrosomonas sp. TaxID=42353 RepID=UPI001E069F16